MHQTSDVQYCLEVDRGKPEVRRVVDGLFAGTVATCIIHRTFSKKVEFMHGVGDAGSRLGQGHMV